MPFRPNKQFAVLMVLAQLCVPISVNAGPYGSSNEGIPRSGNQSSDKELLRILWQGALVNSPALTMVAQQLSCGIQSPDEERLLKVLLLDKGNTISSKDTMELIAKRNWPGCSTFYGNRPPQSVSYHLVSNTAHQLIRVYETYKKNLFAFRCLSDKLKKEQVDAHKMRGVDPASQIDMEYQFRKTQREIDLLSFDVLEFRKELVKIAGALAVEKIDKKLYEQLGDRYEGEDFLPHRKADLG